MKKIILCKYFIFFLSYHGYNQSVSNLSYSSCCVDSIYVPEIALPASIYFYGGEEQFMKFLKFNLQKKINNSIVRDGIIEINITTDSLGNAINLKKIKSTFTCIGCDDLIVNTIKQIHKWIPGCYYYIEHNKIICKEQIITLRMKIKGGKISVFYNYE
jgi:hypothetical protein